MKKVTKRTVLSDEKYYGVLETIRPSKGFLMSKDYRCNNGYRVICRDQVTRGNNFPFLNSATLEDFKKKVIEDSYIFTVYEFETFQELFKWLSE